MADIRINALATTAASTASDDFLAVDGSSQGTRKLNAYSPTFGGNLTVSGTGSHVFGTTNTVTLAAGTVTATGIGKIAGIQVTGASTAATGVGVEVLWDNTSAIIQGFNRNSSVFTPILVGGSTVGLQIGGVTKLGLDASGNATLAGNLTVSGTGNSSVAGSLGIGTTSPGGKLDVQSASAAGNTVLFRGGSYTDIAFATGVRFVAPASTLNSNRQFRFTSGDASLTIQGIDGSGGDAGDTTLRLQPSGGNVLVGTTVNSTGLLQIGTNTSTAAGGIGFGTDTSLYRSAAGQLRGPSSFIDATFSASGLFFGASMTLQANDNVVFKTNATGTALTLDSSQNATFAGSTVTVSKAGNNPALKATDGSIITKLQSLTAGDTAGWVGTESNHTFRIVTNNTTAASFDTSQNATFAGNATIGGANGNLTIKGTGGTASNLNADNNLNINVNSSGSAKTIAISTAGSVTLPSGAALQLGNAYVASAVVPTGYVTIKDSNGTTYKVCVLL